MREIYYNYDSYLNHNIFKILEDPVRIDRGVGRVNYVRQS